MPDYQDIRAFEWFSELTAEEANAVSARCNHRVFQPGQPVFDDQDTSSDVYLISGGLLLAAHLTEDGREVLFSRMGAGQVFGEMAAFDNQPRSLTVYASNDSEAHVIVMPQRVFLDVFDEFASMRHRVTRALVTRIRDITERFNQITTLNVRQRVGALIAKIALEQGKFDEGVILYDMPTHAEIGNAIGANREAVSRAMSQLAKEGIILVKRRKVTLLRPEDLMP